MVDTMKFEIVAQPRKAKIPTSSIKYSEVFFAFVKSVFLSKSGPERWPGIVFLLEKLVRIPVGLI